MPNDTDVTALSPSRGNSQLDAANLSIVDSSRDIVAASPASTPAKRRPRIKPPKDSKVYKIAMATIALRAQGVRGHEAAEQLGIPYETMRTYVKRAVQKGWLTFNSFGAEDKVEYVLTDAAISNANELLHERFTDDDGNQRLSNRAAEITVETLKGTGVFKQHQAVKVDNTTQVGVALKVQVEMPPLPMGAVLPQARPGSVGGAHGTNIPIDAEIVPLKEGE